jgi:hypothetical protein
MMFIATLFIIVEVWKLKGCLFIVEWIICKWFMSVSRILLSLEKKCGIKSWKDIGGNINVYCCSVSVLWRPYISEWMTELCIQWSWTLGEGFLSSTKKMSCSQESDPKTSESLQWKVPWQFEQNIFLTNIIEEGLSK